MANAYFIVTLSTADAGSGPNYNVLYSTDCTSYSPATPSTVTLPNVGAQAYIAVPDNTQCVKLTNINSNCTNSVTASLNITTTTTSTTTTTTTTVAPTTTTTAAPGPTTTTTTLQAFYGLIRCGESSVLYYTSTPMSSGQNFFSGGGNCYVSTGNIGQNIAGKTQLDGTVGGCTCG
jgi:hypothetical protein